MNHRTNPAVVTPAAAQRLPRVALILLGVLYILPGLIGREPWKPYDGLNLSLMIDLANGMSDWLNLSHTGLPVLEQGWLPYWLGAAFIWALPFLEPAVASRIPLGVALTLTMIATWYACYNLARAPQAAPLSFAFGGQASNQSYACAVADASLLALIACLGMAHLGHEFSIHPFATLFVASLFWAFSRIAVAPPEQRLRQHWAQACGAAIALMASGYPSTAILLFVAGVLTFLQPSRAATQRARDRIMALSALVFVLVAYFSLDWPRDGLNESANWTDQALRAIKTWGWLAWPAWPLAIWTLWRWRVQAASPHIWLPVSWILILFVVGVTAGVPQRHLMLALPIWAVLAAFALPTLKRTVLALFDWIALLLFTTVGFVVWFYWLAFQTGSPSAAANAVSRLLPGFVAEFSWIGFLFALIVTCAWFWMIRWRLVAQRLALWSGLVLSATGTVWVWGLLMSLWLPVLNHGMSYDRLAQRLQNMTAVTACVRTSGLPPALVASLKRSGMNIRNQLPESNKTDPCAFWLVSGSYDASRLSASNWLEIDSTDGADVQAPSIRIFERLTRQP